MSYKAGIVKAISDLNDRTGSSYVAIKTHMQANMPADKEWRDATFFKALKDGMEAGDFVKVKASYKLSTFLKDRRRRLKDGVDAGDFAKIKASYKLPVSFTSQIKMFIISYVNGVYGLRFILIFSFFNIHFNTLCAFCLPDGMAASKNILDLPRLLIQRHTLLRYHHDPSL